MDNRSHTSSLSTYRAGFADQSESLRLETRVVNVCKCDPENEATTKDIFLPSDSSFKSSCSQSGVRMLLFRSDL